MGEIHGINDAAKVAMMGNVDIQGVTVSDEDGQVVLRLSMCSYPAGLTSSQARFIANQLIDAAKRVDAVK